MGPSHWALVLCCATTLASAPSYRFSPEPPLALRGHAVQLQHEAGFAAFNGHFRFEILSRVDAAEYPNSHCPLYFGQFPESASDVGWGVGIGRRWASARHFTAVTISH
jgi:hypothetical protein